MSAVTRLKKHFDLRINQIIITKAKCQNLHHKKLGIHLTYLKILPPQHIMANLVSDYPVAEKGNVQEPMHRISPGVMQGWEM
jgi:hypothetical protein